MEGGEVICRPASMRFFARFCIIDKESTVQVCDLYCAFSFLFCCQFHSQLHADLHALDESCSLVASAEGADGI